jgi:hypothetical protein
LRKRSFYPSTPNTLIKFSTGVFMANVTQKSAAKYPLIAMMLASLLMLFACSDKGNEANKAGNAAKATSSEPPSAAKSATAAATATTTTAPVAAAVPLTENFEGKLCKSLETVAPQAAQLGAVGTQAQLVMAVASAFDTNPTALRRVYAEIDTVASASCPAARNTLLKALKMASLQEAVR